MTLAIDVFYFKTFAKTVGFLFEWEDENPKSSLVNYTEEFGSYISGAFYKRELPCILELIREISLSDIDAIIIDGYVHIDNTRQFGLGGHLWEALGKVVPIIGIAKNPYKNNEDTVIKVIRGQSKKPLYVSSIGIDLEIASGLVKNMVGEYRLPTLLKQLDKITKLI